MTLRFSVFLGVWLLAGSLSLSWGFPPARDSLQALVAQAEGPCDRVHPALKLAATYYGSAPTQMAHWGQVALQAATACDHPDAQMRCHNLLGVCHLGQANYRDALQHFLSAYRLADSLGDGLALSQCLNNLGVIYWHQEAYDQAMVIYRRAMTLLDPSRDSLMLARYCYNVGMIFQDHRQQPDSALAYYRRAMTISQRHADTMGLVDVHNSLGLLSLTTGKTALAEHHFRRAMALALPAAQPDQLYYPCYNLARQLLRRQAYQEARSLAQRTLSLAQQTRSYDMLQDSYGLLAALDSAQGDLRSALQHVQTQARYLDSLRDERHHKELQELRTRFELAESEQQNRVLRRRESQQRDIIRTQQHSMIAGTILMGMLAALVIMLIILARQRRQALVDLQHTSEDKDALLSIVAHDLKAPLSNIREIANLLAEQAEADSEAHQFALLVWQEARRGEELVRNLLDFEALQRGQKAPEPHPFDLVDLLQRLQRTYQTLASTKRMTLHWRSELSRARLYTDPVYLTRILDNLLTNAIKFSAPGQSIWLSLQRSKHGLRLAVRDEGPGIAPEDQARLFERYRRLGNRPTQGEASTGLGLSIVKSLSEVLGLEVSVESEVGVGTTFYLHIPPTLCADASACLVQRS